MSKGFSEEEKKRIMEQLLSLCKRSWQTYGYKRTSIDELCQNSGISKGSFYLFFESKEAIFYQVHKETLEQMYTVIDDALQQEPNKKGMKKALKEIYKEYQKSDFMYDTKSIDYMSYFHKLNMQQQEELQYLGKQKTNEILKHAPLTLKIDSDLAFSTIAVILASITFKKDIPCDNDLVFNFMVDHLLDDIFE